MTSLEKYLESISTDDLVSLFEEVERLRKPTTLMDPNHRAHALISEFGLSKVSCAVYRELAIAWYQDSVYYSV